jgi:GH35 family endo-1,4-beta-xylanase
MNSRTISAMIVVATVMIVSSQMLPVFAEVPEAYNKLWSDISGKIDQNIERYRKGDASIEVVSEDGKPVKDAALEIHQKTHAFLFGCNLFVLDQLETPELNSKYEKAFAGLFNFATIPFYWRDLEPEEGKPRFEENSPYIWRRPPPDRLVKWCKAHEITPKGHALMYVKNMFMPDWTIRDNGEKFRTQCRKHMADIAARYGRDIAVWDVVNEEIPRLANLKEWHVVPDDFLAWSFQEAGRLLPREAILMINDGTSQAHVTTAEYEGMIKGLLEKKVRVEGIGLQFHTSFGAMFGGKSYSPDQMYAVYDRLGALGLPLYITEITVPGTGEDGPEKQAAIVSNLYRIWFSAQHMAGITWWNLGDGTAYKNENKALGCLLDKDMNPKPAYQILDKLINHDWRTNISVKTDNNGKARFRGFYGKYTIKITTGNQTKEFEIDLSKDNQTPYRLILKP